MLSEQPASKHLSLFSSAHHDCLKAPERGPLFTSLQGPPEVDPHEDRELNKAPVSAPALSEGTAGFYLPIMEFSSLSFSYQLWEAAE